MITDRRRRRVVLGLAAPLALAFSCGGGAAKPDGGSGQGGGLGA